MNRLDCRRLLLALVVGFKRRFQVGRSGVDAAMLQIIKR
jgi:hypothetical protein